MISPFLRSYRRFSTPATAPTSVYRPLKLKLKQNKRFPDRKQTNSAGADTNTTPRFLKFKLFLILRHHYASHLASIGSSSEPHAPNNPPKLVLSFKTPFLLNYTSKIVPTKLVFTAASAGSEARSKR